MRLFESFLVALSTYSALPVPQFEWNERNMKYAICFFPAVGLICGGALWGWYQLCLMLGISGVLFAAMAVCIPLLITGGIHMDGYMDTVDALASHQPRERKLEIMKDSSSGAFAVIYCGVYLLLSLGLFYELYERRQILDFCLAFVLSRALSAFCAVSLPNARKSGMLCAYTERAEKRNAARCMILAAALTGTAMLCLSPIPGGTAVLFAAAVMLWYRRFAMKTFGGVTGDTSGFFLQLCELACIIGVWIGGIGA